MRQPAMPALLPAGPPPARWRRGAARYARFARADRGSQPRQARLVARIVARPARRDRRAGLAASGWPAAEPERARRRETTTRFWIYDLRFEIACAQLNRKS